MEDLFVKKKMIGEGQKKKAVYTRFCVRCKKYFKTEAHSRTRRVCPKCTKVRGGKIEKVVR